MRFRALYLMAALSVAAVVPPHLFAQAQQSPPANEGQPFVPPTLAIGIEPDTEKTTGDSQSPACQQHHMALNLAIFQPTEFRIQLAVCHQPSCTWLAEVFVGSELFDFLAGGGVRVQFTAASNSRGDALLLSPGLGIHVLPNSYTIHGSGSTETFAAADVDISWVHDFSNRIGYELGLKLGIAGRLAGTGDRYLTFNSDLFPIVSVFSGFRF
jgi:hypothetical protein